MNIHDKSLLVKAMATTTDAIIKMESALISKQWYANAVYLAIFFATVPALQRLTLNRFEIEHGWNSRGQPVIRYSYSCEVDVDATLTPAMVASALDDGDEFEGVTLKGLKMFLKDVINRHLRESPPYLVWLSNADEALVIDREALATVMTRDEAAVADAFSKNRLTLEKVVA